MSAQLSQLLFASHGEARHEYPAILVHEAPRRGPSLRNKPARHEPVLNNLYQYREGGRRRTIEAETPALAVVEILARRTGVKDLKRVDVTWRFSGDTAASGRFRGKQATATLTS